MATVDVSVNYVSTGANRHSAVADWSSKGLVAYGADVNIALWRPNAETPKGVIALLKGHKDIVKAVKFIPQLGTSSNDDILVTGADDNSLKLWSLDESTEKYECIQTVTEHTAPIHCIAILKSTSYKNGIYLASGSADSTIRIWKFQDRALSLIQTITTAPRFFPLALALSALDTSDDTLVLSAAGTKTFVQIYVAPLSATEAPVLTLQSTLTGHEGWIRSLEFVRETSEPTSDLLLSSASQDKYIRIWRLHQGEALPEKPKTATSATYLPGKSPSNKAHILKSGDKTFSVTFEALLLGHEDWIYTAQWLTSPNAKPKLLSTSADNTLAIWEPDADSGIWISMVRLGEISREKGATTATGSTGGFWTGLWSPEGTSVICLGRTGSWRRWTYEALTDMWRQSIGISGHVKPVTGVSWAGNGGYLLSTSTDQTTRLHAPWTKGANNKGRSWHEMARPQIHGYDLNCIDSLGDSQFVSGADEKLMRVFAEPKAVATLLHQLSGTAEASDAMPNAANMPVLGLSNKAIEADPTPEAEAPKPSLDTAHPPFEDSLSRHTLWPEVEKLYGHGYEISCLAASHDGSLIASACKATSTNHAVIRLFETTKWTEIRPPLTAHSLTAARVRFSRDDKMLLSVGRDRQWAIFEKGADGFAVKQTNPKGHTRMILDAAWAECVSPRGFATAGRDKKVNLWVEKAGQFIAGGNVAFDGPITAIDFMATEDANRQILAVGLESGKLWIVVLKFTETVEVVEKLEIADKYCLPKTVLQVSWQPRKTTDESKVLAVAGDDTSLRLYTINGL